MLFINLHSHTHTHVSPITKAPFLHIRQEKKSTGKRNKMEDRFSGYKILTLV